MTTQPVIFKNNLPNMTRLIIESQDIETVRTALRQKIKQAPMMFIGMQLLIDLSHCETNNGDLQINLHKLRDFLTGEGITPLAVITAKQSTKTAAIKAGLGVLPPINAVEKPKTVVKKTIPTTPSSNTISPSDKHKSQANTGQIKNTKTVTKNKVAETSNEEPRKTFSDTQPQQNSTLGNQVITHSIRSGQRIYAKGGDLTVIGAVSQGAEVIADGNVHIYGALRGRAIAGAQGDRKALIFCKKLDAELISIAGHYKQLEEISDEYRNNSVQISLDNEKIRFFTL